MHTAANIPAPSPTDKSSVAHNFDAIAERYDLMQHLNPGYRRHLRISAERLDAAPCGRILDLCCGTGLSTEALAERYPQAELHALDGSAGMLSVARRKAKLAEVTFVQGDAADPQAAGVGSSFDAVFMAYGIRNMVDPDRCLRRIFSLLRPGGRVAFHEYSVRGSLYSRAVWNTVSSLCIVPVGRLLTGTDVLFRYLRASVNRFDSVARFQYRLRQAGYHHVVVAPMDGWQRGIVHTLCAQRPL